MMLFAMKIFSRDQKAGASRILGYGILSEQDTCLVDGIDTTTARKFLQPRQYNRLKTIDFRV
jgi:hypothetical protein